MKPKPLTPAAELLKAMERVAYNLENIPVVDNNAGRFAAQDIRAALVKFTERAAK